MIDLLSGLPEGTSHLPFSESDWGGHWVAVPGEALRRQGGVAFALAGARRWLALERYLPWWPRPVYGSGTSSPEAEYFMILWEREDGGFGVVFPLVDGMVRGVLRGGESGWSVGLPAHDPVPGQATVLLAAAGGDPISLVAKAMAAIRERLGTFRLRGEKSLPSWVDHLGWCTWDAFYLEVSEEKLLAGLEAFRRGGISPRVVILDGGWQDERDEQLWSFGAHPARFPRGIATMISRARRDYGVKVFGAWHTLQGYWNGVHPGGELAGRYRLVASEGVAQNLPGATAQKRALVHPDDARRFFDDYHRALRDAGVNMVKVDNQASLDHFSTPEVPPTTTMTAYQIGLQESVREHFAGESLHCMSHSTDIVHALNSASVWRSSQDFFPAKPETQGLHVFDNVVNSLWVQTFALPDWDMFQSAHPAAGFHAAARAISGGPIYVSDKPGQHDFALLAKLVIHGGQILRCRQPALPARGELFEDGRSQPRLTKIVNHNTVAGLSSPIGVLGLFNCFYGESGPPNVPGVYRAADVAGLSGGEFALYHHVGGGVTVAHSGESLSLELPGLGYELVTVSPLERGVAVFGLVDKFNGSRALESAGWNNPDELELALADGGRVGWHSERSCLAALFEDRLLNIQVRADLSWVNLPEGTPVTLTLRFSPQRQAARAATTDLRKFSREGL